MLTVIYGSRYSGVKIITTTSSMIIIYVYDSLVELNSIRSNSPGMSETN